MAKFKVGDTIQYEYNPSSNFRYEVTRKDDKDYDLLNKYSNSTYTSDIDTIDSMYILVESTNQYLTIPCPHEFVSYVGFRETYKYCVKCDIKE